MLYQWCAFKIVCRTISGYDPYTSYHFILPDFKWSLIFLELKIWEEGFKRVGIWMLWVGEGRMLIFMKIFDSI